MSVVADPPGAGDEGGRAGRGARGEARGPGLLAGDRLRAPGPRVA